MVPYQRGTPDASDSSSDDDSQPERVNKDRKEFFPRDLDIISQFQIFNIQF